MTERAARGRGSVRRWLRRTAIAVMLLLIVLQIGAWLSSPRQENEPLPVHDPEGGYRFTTDDGAANRLFVCVTMSGGGTRAAAFSYGVLEELLNTEIEWPPDSGRRVSLLSEVDILSASSGGSFTAAYYGLFKQRTFTDFRERVLYRDITKDLFWRAMNPLRWPRLFRPDFSRSDLAAEYYQEKIFDGRRFSDLSRRPFVVINATNVAFGSGFSFSQSFFDYLGSNLATFPVGRAVAASSAFPLLLSPLTLRNHPPARGFDLPEDVKQALAGPQSKPRRYAQASRLAPYHLEKEGHPYLHLLDGALSDNLGLRYVIDSYLRGEIRTLLNRTPGGIDRLIVIVANAKGESDEDLDRDASPPGETDVSYKTATVSMDNYTFETLELMAEFLDQRRQTQEMLEAVNQWRREAGMPGLSQLPMIESSLIEVSLEQISDLEERRALLSVPTTLTLPRDVVDELINKGRELLRRHGEFQELIDTLR